MANDCRLDIPEGCRRFGGADFDLRLQLAKGFVEKFAETVAPLKEFDERDCAWTFAVRRRLVEICPQDCYALPDDSGSGCGGYLVDYAWAEMNDRKRILLACECEWGTGWFGKTSWARVENEFEKLLAAKSALKVLIFSSCDAADPSDSDPNVNFSFEHAKKRIENSLQTYWHHIPGETYIFVDLPQTREPRREREIPVAGLAFNEARKAKGEPQGRT